MMDTGKRGKINLEELRVGLQKLGQQIPDADLQILVESVSVLLFLIPGSESGCSLSSAQLSIILV